MLDEHIRAIFGPQARPSCFTTGERVSWNGRQFEAIFPPNNGDRLRASGLHVAHIHPAKDFLGAAASRNITTVVYRPREDEKHTIEVATAVCSESDTFSKRTGVNLAYQRWEEGERVHLPARVTPQSDYQLLLSYFG